MDASYLTVTEEVVAEKVTVRIEGTIKDGTQVVLTVDTLTLRVFERTTGKVVNGITARDIKNANGGTFDEGAIQLRLSPDDGKLVDPKAVSEIHVAQITWTYNEGQDTGRAEVEFTVRNLRGVR